MAISREEKLRRKREAEKKRRKKIQADPELHVKENEKCRKRYAARKEKNVGKKLSIRAKNAQRLKWRLQKRKQLAKKKANSPLGTRSESMRDIIRKRNESRRVRHHLVLKQLKEKNETLNRSVAKYRKRLYRLQWKVNSNSNSPRSTLKRELKKSKVSPEVSRKLLFRTSVSIGVEESLSNITSSKKKRLASSFINLKYLKKYKFLTSSKPFFSINFYERKRGEKRKKMVFIKKAVRRFLEDDENSRMSPGKKDTKTDKGIKKQKRYLTDSLKRLYLRFCETHDFVISYTTFTRLRPFWVDFQRVQDRETCGCQKHDNIRYMCEQLNRLKVVSSGNVDKLIETEMCCEPATDECWFRKCSVCCERNIIFLQEYYDGDKECSNDAWEAVIEGGYRHINKVKKVCKVHELISRFSENIPKYMSHVGNIRHQCRIMRELKKHLTEKDLLLHVDFAENYNCKYGHEIKSIHFGGNRKQISLHTGVLYNGSTRKSFCTISSDLNHGPVAIVNHLKEILKDFPEIENLIFLSDGPSSQYRNKYMFYLMRHEIIPSFKFLRTFSWNFSEADHGKGAPDGVGAVLKRTCDRVVSYNRDIANIQQFSACVKKEVKKIHVVAIDSVSCEEMNKKARQYAIEIKGTYKSFKTISKLWLKLYFIVSSFCFRLHESSSSNLVERPDKRIIFQFSIVL